MEAAARTGRSAAGRRDANPRLPWFLPLFDSMPSCLGGVAAVRTKYGVSRRALPEARQVYAAELTAAMSRRGGAPNMRAYSRLNCEALS